MGGPQMPLLTQKWAAILARVVILDKPTRMICPCWGSPQARWKQLGVITVAVSGPEIPPPSSTQGGLVERRSWSGYLYGLPSECHPVRQEGGSKSPGQDPVRVCPPGTEPGPHQGGATIPHTSLSTPRGAQCIRPGRSSHTSTTRNQRQGNPSSQHEYIQRPACPPGRPRILKPLMICCISAGTWRSQIVKRSQ